MSGGGGGVIIIGDDTLIKKVAENIDKVAPFRLARAKSIIQQYHVNENAITRGDQQFILRCGADILDNV